MFGGIGTRSPSWVVAGATLVVAALFQPARRRIQQVVDKLYERLVKLLPFVQPDGASPLGNPWQELVCLA